MYIINAFSISEIDLLVDKLIKDIEKVKDENNINIDLICFAGDLIGRGDMHMKKKCRYSWQKNILFNLC